MFCRLVIVFSLLVIDSPVGEASTLLGVDDEITLAKAKRKRRKRRRRGKRRAKKSPKTKKQKPAATKAASEPVPEKAKAEVKPPVEVAAPGTTTEKTSSDGKADKPGKPGIALTEVKTVHGVAEGVAKLVNEMILIRLKNSDRFGTVIGSSDMAAMIDMETQKQALGCDDDSCLAELGGALGVPYLLHAQLGKMGSRIILTLKIIAIEEAEVAVRKIARSEGEGELGDAVEPLVDEAIIELLGAPKSPPPSTTKPEPKAPAAVAIAPAQRRSRPLVKWGGVTLALAGTGFAARQWLQWSSQQQAFDAQTTAHTTADLQALRQGANDSNTASTVSLSVAGLGLVMVLIGW